jgi:pyruvate/2-oxoglutarate dehydrogenase complex dihydrolipoamide dehydrogenase (E3) component
MREMNRTNMTAPADLQLVIGSGRFVNPKTIEVRHYHETRQFEAEKVFINTGTPPVRPATRAR